MGQLDVMIPEKASGARPQSLVESEVLPKTKIFPGIYLMAKARI